VFAITPSGEERVLHSFGGGGDGVEPFASLVNVNRTLFGTTSSGGAHNAGTVFSIMASGKERVLHSFGGSAADGAGPYAGLINVGGTLYGTTNGGGVGENGTVFSITTSGIETVVHRFQCGKDGFNPYGTLINVNGTLYGTTVEGFACSGGYGGTVYTISKSGRERVIHQFSGTLDGYAPYAGLINVNGTLYGTTLGGGSNGLGTVFALTR
jgi:uncharacterized repeat protein (TIGR03803 family)